ncbi:DEHA2E12364p [Debaryomyces hansenii CBS767]|uniref:DEHA2E12364p n=1 Tax=Debaryomyces hansenii (strain ATCC 36239 / CBS 767 / BCRC 21394 / JCM 1990 / NBRC 0083 / IGC 2968) TaxID=284592 RepID=Q6BPM6_DEBHA|nr:DEHA2E12364p [Debaryomyces hansenii CBS767]CAG88083.2 DEHA2E12364p [Debaryomyces hansenii CBS767]|eukprot:XP_459844.2 DEHA2E12364p [Debaryomyces hansenii CBS767]
MGATTESEGKWFTSESLIIFMSHLGIVDRFFQAALFLKNISFQFIFCGLQILRRENNLFLILFSVISSSLTNLTFTYTSLDCSYSLHLFSKMILMYFLLILVDLSTFC